jgi:hypothetical protein
MDHRFVEAQQAVPQAGIVLETGCIAHLVEQPP